MSFTKSTIRRARKTHVCDGYRCARRVIFPGELYADCVAAPDPWGLGNKTWWRVRECENCCAEAGRPVRPKTPG